MPLRASCLWTTDSDTGVQPRALIHLSHSWVVVTRLHSWGNPHPQSYGHSMPGRHHFLSVLAQNHAPRLPNEGAPVWLLSIWRHSLRPVRCTDLKHTAQRVSVEVLASCNHHPDLVIEQCHRLRKIPHDLSWSAPSPSDVTAFWPQWQQVSPVSPVFAIHIYWLTQ